MKQLLQKFILNQCDQEEIDQIVEYCRSNKLTPDFPTVDEIKALLDEMPEMEIEKADEIFSNILKTAPLPKVIPLQPKRKLSKYIAAAASIALLLAVGLLYQKGFFNGQQKMVIDPNSITLQLENGNIQVISENGTSVIIDAQGNVVGNQNGNKLIYDTKTGLEKLVYNTIKIPNGKRFQLQLSDGTNVHLNAGTTLKFPVKFIAGQSRNVFLDGEAFFDVTKDAAHPFVVNADDLDVRVLGTHFNVSNYPEDAHTDVVLVEGSVGMHTSDTGFDPFRHTVLKPGYKGSFNKTDNSINAKRVNTTLYTAWIKGGQNFRDMTFANIAKKLERHYNVTIVNTDVKLANEKFNASFGNQPIEKVLSYFSDIHAFNYTVTNNEIIIK